jgi:hypothetical protein
MATRDELQSKSSSLTVQISSLNDQFNTKLTELKGLQDAGVDTQSLEIELNNLKQQKAELDNDLTSTNTSLSNLNQSEDPTATVKTPDATNPSQTDQDTANKYAKSESVGVTNNDEFGDLEGAIQREQMASSSQGATAFDLANMEPQGVSSLGESSRSAQLVAKGITPGAEKLAPTAAKVRTLSASGKELGSDLRAKIRVPLEYFYAEVLPPGLAQLRSFNGIIFPYTPQISFGHTANYAPQQPLHSNFSFNFYQRSSVSNISIVAQFTVQNNNDAAIYLGTIQLLSALTKMKTGNDFNAGAPPPICRLDAFGTYMLKNVPIAIGSFRVELPNSVDYFIYNESDPENLTSVPVISTIQLECVLMYSRREMQEFTVDNFINSYAWQKKKGFL